METEKQKRTKAKTAKPRRKYKPRVKKPSAPAPEASSGQPAGAEKSGGLLSGIGGLFEVKKAEQPKPTPPASQPGAASTPSLNGCSRDLSPDAERLLASVPDQIADTLPGQLPGGAELPEAIEPGSVDSDGAALAELISADICDADDVKELLVMVGGWLADLRKREAYRLSDSRAGLMARPWAQVINHLWTTHAPAILTEVCDSVPGLAKALIMTGLAFGPAVMADVQQTRAERAQAKGRVKPTPAQMGAQQPKPATAPTGGAIGPCVVQTQGGL